MSVELSKAIMLAAIHVQQTGHSTTTTIAQPDDTSLSSSQYRKCRKRIRALNAIVEELRHELRTYTWHDPSSVDAP